MVGVEQWAEIRRLYFVKRLSIKEIARRTGRDRNTVRRALRSERPPRYSRPPRAVEARPLQGGDPPAAGRGAAAAGQADPRAACWARLRGRQDDPRRLSARGAAAVSAAAAHLSAHLVSAGGAVPVRPLGAEPGDPGWQRPDAARLRRRRLPALLARRRRRARVLEGGARPPVRDRRAASPGSAALPETLVWDREGALHAGGGRPTEPFAAFCGELRVGWRFLEPRDPQSKGVVERLQGYLETSFEPGRAFRQRARLPGAARPLVLRAGQPALPPHAALPPDRPAGRGADRDAAAPRADARRRPPPGHAHRRPTRTCASTATTTRSTRAWSDAGSSCASRNGSSSPPASTRASSPADTAARLPATARSPRSSTPGRCASCAAPRPSQRSRHGPSPATTR